VHPTGFETAMSLGCLIGRKNIGHAQRQNTLLDLLDQLVEQCSAGGPSHPRMMAIAPLSAIASNDR
jgi:hypothetical protein